MTATAGKGDGMIAWPIPKVSWRSSAISCCLNQSKGGSGKAGLVRGPWNKGMIGPVKVSAETNLASNVMRKVSGNSPALSFKGYLHGSWN